MEGGKWSPNKYFRSLMAPKTPVPLQGWTRAVESKGVGGLGNGSVGQS